MDVNLLIDRLPTSVIIDETEYDINSDFRTSIKFNILSNSDTNYKNKITKILYLYYPIIPKNIDMAMNKILWFYNCGKESRNQKANTLHQKSEPTYSFEEDSLYIYSAFRCQYNINLQTDDLHWWEFISMFECLKEDNLICRIMHYRGTDLNKVPKEQRQFYRNMKTLYALKRNTIDIPLNYEEYKNKMKDYVDKRFKETNLNGQ